MAGTVNATGVNVVNDSGQTIGISARPMNVSAVLGGALAAGTALIGKVTEDPSFVTLTHGSYKVLAINTANQRIGAAALGAIYSITLSNAAGAAQLATLELNTGPVTLLAFNVPATSTVHCEFGSKGFEWADAGGIQVDTGANVSGLVVYRE